MTCIQILKNSILGINYKVVNRILGIFMKKLCYNTLLLVSSTYILNANKMQCRHLLYFFYQQHNLITGGTWLDPTVRWEPRPQ